MIPAATSEECGVTDLVNFLRQRLDEDLQPCEGAKEYGDCHDISERRVRDAEAKRRIIKDHYLSMGWFGNRPTCARCYDGDDVHDDGSAFPCLTLRLLTLPYASHSEYDERWRP